MLLFIIVVRRMLIYGSNVGKYICYMPSHKFGRSESICIKGGIFINKNVILVNMQMSTNSTEVLVHVPRSSMTGFDWKTSRLFCAEMCVIDERNISREKERIRRVETIEMRRKILERCEIKTNEERTSESNLKKTEVQHIMLSCFDLVAAEAVYHKNCHKEFFKAKEQNTSNSTTDDKKSETFGELCDTLEFLAEPITMSELRKQIVAKHGVENVYTSKWIKKKLREKYGDDIIMPDDTYSTIMSKKSHQLNP